jgi:predicted ATP-dependent endonuclease of OLD family
MILSKIDIKAFKSITELSIVFDSNVNVLIGANESGKTNILKAIEAFRSDVPFDNSSTCQYSNHYYMGKSPEIELEFSKFTKENMEKLEAVSKDLKGVDRFTIRREGSELTDYVLLIDGHHVENVDVKKLLPLLPKIIYFSDIPLMKSKVDFSSLNSNGYDFSTERNLLKIAGVDDFETLFEDSNRGRRVADEASRIITQQLRRTWSQEPSMEIKLHINGNVLYIDFSDSTTVLDTPDARSMGFRWYLSFYVNFISKSFAGKSNEFIFLIDEPGIHLHPSGQKDLIKVLEDISLNNQLIYTTHSPFLINRDHPDRVFLISKDKEGTHVDSASYRENWRPLRQEVGLSVSDLFFFNDNASIKKKKSSKKFLGLFGGKS